MRKAGSAAGAAIFMLGAGILNSASIRAEDHPFVRPDAAPVQSAPEGACDFQYPSKIPVRCWTGQKFIALPAPTELRVYGYQTFDGGSGEYGHPTYEELAGKVLTAVSVRWHDDRFQLLSGWVVTFKSDDTGRTYTVKPVLLPNENRDEASVREIALLRDLEEARKQYVGQKYWILISKLPRVGTDVTGDDYVRYRRISVVTISDVLAGEDSSRPVRLVLKNDAGEEGYMDIAGSPTNMSSSLYATMAKHLIDRELSSIDPHLLHKWPARIWSAIEQSTVLIGMTTEQAEMSWDGPSTVNRTIVSGRVHEQWVYSQGRYLYFENGVLTAIQD
ncbi:MAG TPA: hypothetical protein VMF58_04715 [Rhizomicrobium sp.]|nr:hypothetical protein [Rhizomicrobium sp.]